MPHKQVVVQYTLLEPSPQIQVVGDVLASCAIGPRSHYTTGRNANNREMKNGRNMKYLRLYAGEDGESHVEEMWTKFDSQQYAPPAPEFGISAANGTVRLSINLTGPNA